MRYKNNNQVNYSLSTEAFNINRSLAVPNRQMSNIQNVLDGFAAQRKPREAFCEKGIKLGFKFTKQEIKNMPEKIRKIFIANNFIVNYRITNNGYYEARVRRKDLYIEASGRDFETMRSRFMQKLQATFRSLPELSHIIEDPCPISPRVASPTPKPEKKNELPLFTKYAEEWLKIKEQTTKPSTFKEYVRSYKVDLKPVLSGKRLNEITRQQLQNYMFTIIKEGKHRKAEKLSLMLNCIFDLAADDFNISSPMKKVVLPNRPVKSGQALDMDEEERLINYCKSNKHIDGTDALLVLLLFGLRKSELASIEIVDGKWLQCETSKERLGQNVVLRRIPFTPMAEKLRPHIDFERAKHTNLNTISSRMKKLFPNHHPHELRHTFITRCKECGVVSEVVSLWAGHSLSGTITSTVYTHYSAEFQLREAEKVFY